MDVLFYFFVGCLGTLAITVGFFKVMPIWALVFVGVLLAGLIRQPKFLGPAFLIRGAIILYSITFLPLLDHVFVKEPDYAWAFPQVQAAMADERISVFLMLVGVVGLGGLLAGVWMVNAFKRAQVPAMPRMIRDQPLMASGTFVVLAAVLSVFFMLVTPKDTILTMSYGDLLSESSSTMEGFAGFGYMVYILMAIMWIDLERRRETIGRSRSLEMFFWLFVGFVVIYCNLLRGGRSVASTVMTFGILYYTMSLAPGETRGGRFRKLILFLAPTAFVFMIWAEVRASFASGGGSGGPGFWETLTTSYKSGAWMGGLFAGYGMGEEYFKGHFDWLKGKTYLDYFLSLPPSPIASAFHYMRPIEGEQGPSWWYMGYTVGGMSQVIVPFKNFGAIGVFVHMTFVGAFVSLVEWKQALQKGFWRVVYAAIFVSYMHWFWYGDMYIIRALMLVGLWYLLLSVTRPRLS